MQNKVEKKKIYLLYKNTFGFTHDKVLSKNSASTKSVYEILGLCLM